MIEHLFKGNTHNAIIEHGYLDPTHVEIPCVTTFTVNSQSVNVYFRYKVSSLHLLWLKSLALMDQTWIPSDVELRIKA